MSFRVVPLNDVSEGSKITPETPGPPTRALKLLSFNEDEFDQPSPMSRDSIQNHHGKDAIDDTNKSPGIFKMGKITAQSSLSRITTTTESEIDSVYRKFDKDNDGEIGTRELEFIRKAMANQIGMERAQEVVRVADENSDNTMSKSEFLVMMHRYKREKMHRVKEMVKQQYDSDKLLQQKIDSVSHRSKVRKCVPRKQICIHTLRSIFCPRTEALIVFLSSLTIACLYPLLKATYIHNVCMFARMCVCMRSLFSMYKIWRNTYNPTTSVYAHVRVVLILSNFLRMKIMS